MIPAVSFSSVAKAKAQTAIILVGEGGQLFDQGRALDKETKGAISHFIKTSHVFTGKAGQIGALPGPQKHRFHRLVLLGIGKPDKLGIDEIAALGGRFQASFATMKVDSAQLQGDGFKAFTAVRPEQAAAHFAAGLALRSYSFEKYKTKEKQDKAAKPCKIEIVLPAATKATALYKHQKAVTAGVFLARDLVNEPPNILYPASFASRVRSELVPLGVKVEVLDEKKMTQLGFKAHLAVGQGSIRPPRVVVLHWAGGRSKTTKPVAFVGKGVTFDTGGINLKPSDGMADMKMDMGGAAAVVGLFKALALRNAKINAVGIIGLAENMPSDRSYRPSDVIGSLSGKTIEVLNTDAEGRLVLADALTYIQKKHDPRFVIDLATLTGAIMIALGHEYGGAFVNDDKLWGQMEAASKVTGEKLWRMPLDEAFKNSMKGSISDVQNLSTMGRYGGACSAAGFLSHFIDDKRVWAHMDIAGTAWVNKDLPLAPRHATGFGVRVLNQLLTDHYET
ncbi:MAG: leucyl aminopeptidase [Alphaproteobacteria bacterium]|nr:leucyl aminopeptidase [Alphaproteobacteria bacterium]